MAADKKRTDLTEEEIKKAEKSRKTLHATIKVLCSVLILSAIPAILYNPDLSLGPFDFLRQEFFKTELVLTGEKFSSDGFIHTIRSTDMRKIKLYIRSGANVDAMGKLGVSPLCAAAQTGNIDAVNVLLDANANILQKNASNGLTPVFCAIEGNNIEILEKLLDEGVSIRTRTEQGLSMVQYASLLGREQMLSYLLTKGADPNMQNMYGQTALHYAVTQDNSYILNILLSAGALVDVVDIRGNSPIDLAQKLDKQSYVRQLSRYSTRGYIDTEQQ